MTATYSISGEDNVLKALVKFVGCLAKNDVPCVFTRVDDRARQLACKRGLATFDKKNNVPRGAGWSLTEAGVSLANSKKPVIEAGRLSWT